MNATRFTDHFLIAMPGLEDPHFAQALVYICAHNEQGALGLVVNRPLDLTLGEVLAQLEMPPASDEVAARPVFYGGPVEMERGFVLHHPAGAWESTFVTPTGVALTSSRDILRAIAAGSGPERHLMALGYAGWAAGQLEDEVAANVWLCGEGDVQILFDLPPEARLRAVAEKMGVDLSRLSSQAGHA